MGTKDDAMAVVDDETATIRERLEAMRTVLREIDAELRTVRDDVGHLLDAERLSTAVETLAHPHAIVVRGFIRG